jgi:hypothetical protein
VKIREFIGQLMQVKDQEREVCRFDVEQFWSLMKEDRPVYVEVEAIVIESDRAFVRMTYNDPGHTFGCFPISVGEAFALDKGRFGPVVRVEVVKSGKGRRATRGYTLVGPIPLEPKA